MNRPDYPPTWTDTSDDGFDWIVYDQREGFTPAYALVRTYEASNAAEIAEELSDGRLAFDSETLVVVSS